MKLAIVGKGGAGKTTLAASLCRRLAGQGRSVIAVDADPDGNLPAALGLPAEKTPEPIARMRDLVLERTGARDQGAGLFFRLNPKVDDLPAKFSVVVGGVRLLVLGTVETGGKGCMCPEGAVLKALLQHLLLRIPDDVVLDMEAGLEHMGRASAAGTDALIAVVEPGMRSVQTATRVRTLARDIGVGQVLTVINRVRRPEEEKALREALKDEQVVGVLPFSEALVQADLEGRSVEVDDSAFVRAVESVGDAIESRLAAKARS